MKPFRNNPASPTTLAKDRARNSNKTYSRLDYNNLIKYILSIFQNDRNESDRGDAYDASVDQYEQEQAAKQALEEADRQAHAERAREAATAKALAEEKLGGRAYEGVSPKQLMKLFPPDTFTTNCGTSDSLPCPLTRA